MDEANGVKEKKIQIFCISKQEMEYLLSVYGLMNRKLEALEIELAGTRRRMRRPQG